MRYPTPNTEHRTPDTSTLPHSHTPALLLAGFALLATHGAAARAAPDDAGVVHSQRLASGIPLGGIGCGTLQLMTDGTISRATINNNWEQPLGDLRGCFAALWTRAGGRSDARVLALHSGYNLPAAPAVDFRGLTPQAFVEYPDPSLPVTVSLRAYSALVPQDRQSSCLPAALFVFTIRNMAHASVEASVALSWENLLGVGGTAATGRFADRTGNTVEPIVPDGTGEFGLRMASARVQATDPPDRLRYNAQGSYALLTQPAGPDDRVTTAAWNALDNTPSWWSGFAGTGEVQATAGPGREGSVHPAGVVAVRVSLRDRGVAEIPFVLAWYTRRLYTLEGSEYGHLYEKSFGDAEEVARFALSNRLSLAALTDEWQHRLLWSSLPPWLARRLIDDTGSLLTNSIATRDGGLPGPEPGPPLFTTLLSVGARGDDLAAGSLGGIDRRLFASALYTAFFPSLARQGLQQFATAQPASGAVPRLDGNLDRVIDGPNGANVSGGRDRPFASACAYAFQVCLDYLRTGDQAFLDHYYPAAKHAIQFASSQLADRPEDAGLWRGTLQAGRRMADAMQDRRFLAECEGYLAAAGAPPASPERHVAGASSRADGREPSSADVIGRWMEDLVAIAAGAAPYRAPLRAPEDAGSRVDVPLAVLQACTAAYEGSPDAALAAMEAVDTAIVRQERSPWQYPEVIGSAATALEPNGRQATEAPIATEAMPASWWFLEAIEGFGLDLAQGRVVLAPRLPVAWKSLSAPIFMPTFWAWLEYRPGPGRADLTFRLDRFLPTAAAAPRAGQAERAPALAFARDAAIVVRQVVLPAGPSAPTEVVASVGRAPAPGKLNLDALGRPVFTFDSPPALLAGQRISFDIRYNPTADTRLDR